MGVKISSLPIIVTPALSDVFPVVQGGVTYKESFTQLSSLFATAGANSNITSLSGLTTPLSAAQGGTGVNNGASTITLGGSLSTVGAFTAAFTMTGNTAVTFPTSGTLLTSAGAVTSLIATANQTTVSSATGNVTIGMDSNPVIPGTAGVTLPKGTVAQRAGASGTIRFNTDASVFEVTLDGATWVTLDTHTAGDVDSIIGTANQIIASSPTGNVTLSLPQSIATTSDVTFGSVAFSPTTKGIVGTTTNDDAAAGYVGEILSAAIASASAVSLTSNTIANITSISLTAGDWDITGQVGFELANTTSITQIRGWLSTSALTLPSTALISQPQFASSYSHTATATTTFISAIGPGRLSLSGPATLYIDCRGTFSVSTLKGYGFVFARRIR